MAPSDAGVRVTVDGGQRVEAEQLVVAVGRKPRAEGLGLERVGIEPGEEGASRLMRTAAPAEGVWAVGDVTGVAQFTHVAVLPGADRGRRHARAARATPTTAPCRGSCSADPEVAAVGLTPEQARERGVEVATATVELSEPTAPRPTGASLQGAYGVLADRERRHRSSAPGPSAPSPREWIHPIALAILVRTPLGVLSESMAQFPSFAEAWPMAARELSA